MAAVVFNDADIVNLNVDVSVGGATVTTDYGGGDALAGWALAVVSGDDLTDVTSLTRSQTRLQRWTPLAWRRTRRP